MSNQEISKLLYEEMAAAFDAYKSVEEEYRAQTEYCEKQSILARLIQARGAWLGSVEKFRTHLAYLRQRAGGSFAGARP